VRVALCLRNLARDGCAAIEEGEDLVVDLVDGTPEVIERHGRAMHGPKPDDKIMRRLAPGALPRRLVPRHVLHKTRQILQHHDSRDHNNGEIAR